LHRRVWAPLEPALQNADHVFLSVEGELNLLPFAALPDKAGRPLIERMRFTHVTSGRDLLRSEKPAPARSALLLLADPDFDARPAGAAASPEGASLKFDRLPGTAREAAEIPGLIAGPAS